MGFSAAWAEGVVGLVLVGEVRGHHRPTEGAVVVMVDGRTPPFSCHFYAASLAIEERGSVPSNR